ncbi:dolichol-phosphate mannosyltransferase [Singulisphaera sp. GP187]|uniref:glycosyltransferase family 2 protein n=1 Tax=Singulisphaera sp. GP187 TaxID=1882752 RepID=UPI000926923C|nr:glycosyltransferase family 2 protein [Singulisphaera sp. GP187]SIO56392.1 dolichol-phosphate mannosyltransferase [Singulisphaera sp. GP187]
MNSPYLSIVVPCYNEEEMLDELYRRLKAVCLLLGRSYEIVFVDDGSKDRSWPILESLAAADPFVVAVALSRNHGHQLALTAGLQTCQGERILIIDADLQDPPELLPAMLDRMDAGLDVVYGQRRRRDGETAFKRGTAALFYRLITCLSEVPIPPDTGDFRLMSRRALNVLLAMPEHHRFIRGMVPWIGFPQAAMPYDRQCRYAGVSKFPLRKMVRFALDAITAFSTKPLILASWFGIGTALITLALAAYSLASWVGGNPVSEWMILIIVISLFGSLQLLVLGILGEYLGRMYEQTKNRPLFIIKNLLRWEPSPTLEISTDYSNVASAEFPDAFAQQGDR